jgi:hypothetical protein
MQAEMMEVGELFKKLWSGSSDTTSSSDLKKYLKDGAKERKPGNPLKPNSLNFRASAGFRSMIPVPKTKSPVKQQQPPPVTPRRKL